MNRLLTVLTTVFLALNINAQVNIVMENDPGTSLNGQTIDYVIDYDFSFHKVYMNCFNTSGSDAKYKFAREILSSDFTFDDQLCDNNLCYPLSGTIDTTGLPSATVVDGDSSIMQPIFIVSTPGNALIKYYILDANNNDAIIDSFSLNITSALSIEKIDIDFSSYPNPANENVFINFQGNEGMNFQVVFYNVIGEEVMTRSLKNGVNKIGTQQLKNGIYFYSVVANNDIIETKKLIIRH